jgi:hypothetical protein
MKDNNIINFFKNNGDFSMSNITNIDDLNLKYNFRFLFFTKIKIGGVYV